MLDGWGKRIAVVVVVLLAAANVVFWAGYSKSKPGKTSFSQQIPLAPPSSTQSLPVPVTSNPLTLPKPVGRPLLVSVVGDSIAAGRYASGPGTRFRALMLSALSATGPVTPEEAVPTGTSALSTAVTVPSGQDLVVLEVGTDDMRVASVTQFEMAFGALIASIQADSPNADLVCAGTWSATGGLYDAIIQRDCAAAKGRYVSLQALYDTPAYHGPAGASGPYGTSNGIAPNDAGHHAIAAALLGAVGLKLS